MNYHTGYYRHAEGLSTTAPMSAAEYVQMKIGRRPFAALDVVGIGLFVRPFETKWRLYDIWIRGLASVLSWTAAAGLALWLFSSVGRFMLFVLIAALIPYAFTWNVGGGGEWRFTMHVYSIYLVAAVHAVFSAGTLLTAALRRRQLPWRELKRKLAWRAAALAAVVAAFGALYVGMPWLVKREAIASGEAVNVEAGARDRVFFRRGWSAPHADGAVTVRVSLTGRAAIHFPLPQKRAYEIALRVDPVAPDVQDRVTVLFNRQLVGRLRLSWTPDRVGTYRLSLPVEWVRAGDNEIELITETMVTAATAGPRFAWLDPAERLGLRLWYLRVLD